MLINDSFWFLIAWIVGIGSLLGAGYIMLWLYLYYLKYLRESLTRTSTEENGGRARFRRLVIKSSALSSLLMFMGFQTICLITLAGAQLLNSSLLVHSFLFIGLASFLNGLYMVLLMVGHDWTAKIKSWLVSRFRSS